MWKKKFMKGKDIFGIFKGKFKTPTDVALKRIDEELEPKKYTKVKDIIGMSKGWKKSTKRIMKETDKEFQSKFIR